MNYIQIKSQTKKMALPGDYAIELVKTGPDLVAFVPKNIYNAVGGEALNDVKELVEFVCHFEGVMVRSLNWTQSEVRQANEKLRKDLSPFVHSVSVPRTVKRRVYGARRSNSGNKAVGESRLKEEIAADLEETDTVRQERPHEGTTRLKENLLLYIEELEHKRLYFKESYLAAQKRERESDYEYYVGKFFLIEDILLDLKAMVK